MTLDSIASFRAGGTLSVDAPSYIERPADRELLDLAGAGQFCYVLSPRQMGKSSLMERVALHLAEQGACCAKVDLSALGVYLSAEQWFRGFLRKLAGELGLTVDLDSWWQGQHKLPPTQRFCNFISDVVLMEVPGRVVVFVDEIDTTFGLAFSDDFFAAVRAIYNLRATEPPFQRIGFVLLGVAAPADLIKAKDVTPFNIGQAIDLTYLSRTAAGPLERVLKTLPLAEAGRCWIRSSFGRAVTRTRRSVYALGLLRVI